MPGPACLAGLSKHTVLSRQLFDNASLAVAMARGIKATLLCTHGPTVLTNPEPCSADFSLPEPCVYSNWAYLRHVSMPLCNDTDHIRKGSSDKDKSHP